jgi:hypothetical protein
MQDISREQLAHFHAAQAAQDILADEVRDLVSEQEWDAIISFNTYCSNKLGLTLDFYRQTNGTAAYRFRPATAEEKRERAEDWVEDHL